MTPSGLRRGVGRAGARAVGRERGPGGADGHRAGERDGRNELLDAHGFDPFVILADDRAEGVRLTSSTQPRERQGFVRLQAAGDQAEAVASAVDEHRRRRHRRSRSPRGDRRDTPASAQLVRHRGHHAAGRLRFGSRRRARVPRRRALLGGQELLRRCRPQRQRSPRQHRPPLPRGGSHLLEPEADRRRGAGRGRRRRPRARALGRLPRRQPRDPLQLQLRPARVPPGIRHLGDAARGRRTAARAGAHVHRRRRARRGGPSHRSRRPPRRRPTSCAARRRRSRQRSRRRPRWPCSRSARPCAATSRGAWSGRRPARSTSSSASATPTTSARVWPRSPSGGHRTSRAGSRAGGAPTGIDLESFPRWAAVALPGLTAPFRAELIAGGQSNITAHMTDADGPRVRGAPPTAAQRPPDRARHGPRAPHHPRARADTRSRPGGDGRLPRTRT